MARPRTRRTNLARKNPGIRTGKTRGASGAVMNNLMIPRAGESGPTLYAANTADLNGVDQAFTISAISFGLLVAPSAAGDAKAMRAAADEFLQLLLDMDELLATRREFLLGRWLADARRWGETEAERARLQWNARRVLTCWGSGGHTLDYARKEWSGMISDFYHERWRRRLDAEIAAISEERPLDVKALDKQLRQRDLDWSARRDSLPTEPRGDAIALARGIQGWKIRVTRRLNRLWHRQGTVWSDRYHALIIQNLQQLRNTLSYVLHNARHHRQQHGRHHESD